MPRTNKIFSWELDAFDHWLEWRRDPANPATRAANFAMPVALERAGGARTFHVMGTAGEVFVVCDSSDDPCPRGNC